MIVVAETPIGDRRRYIAYAFNAGDGVFDRLGDLRFELGRARRRTPPPTTVDNRNIRVRQAGDRQLMKLSPAQHQQNDGEHNRRKRLTDRPRGNVEGHCLALLAAIVRKHRLHVVAIVKRAVPALAIISSPSFTPSRTSILSSENKPVLTWRASTTESCTTCTVVPPLSYCTDERGIDTPQL